MSLLFLVAGAAFLCAAPSHHDGDNIHCAGGGSRSMRLYGIDAPEMPGACRPGRDCTPGDPYAARATLQGLTRGREVRCEQLDTDVYDRRIVRCTADGEDLSCAMVASGAAVARYGRLDCGAAPRRSAARLPEREQNLVEAEAPVAAPLPIGAEQRGSAAAHTPTPRVPAPRNPAETTRPIHVPPAIARPLPLVPIALWLLAINIAAYGAFAIDKRRAEARPAGRVRRIPESTLLLLAVVGGSIGAVAAQQILRHKTRKQPFATRLLVITGVQAGIVAGLSLL